MNRRKFLRLSAPLALAPFALNGIPLRAFATNSLMQQLSCDGVSDRVLVVIQLKGGNDGINTLIPIAQYDTYANLRPTIRIPSTGTGAYIGLDSTLPSADQLGLHPAMTAIKSLYDAGKVNIIQGVGYANQNRSHFKGTDLWLTGGDSTPENYNINTGWMGRYLGYTYPGIGGNPTADMPDPLGIQLGATQPSLGFHTADEHTVAINLSGQDPSGFYSLVSEIGGAPIANIPNNEYGAELQYIMDVEQSVSVYAERISTVFNAGNNIATYPEWNLADQLRTIARLIQGGSRTKIYLTQLNGFDTHNVQIDPSEPSIGIHASLLQELSESVKAFQDDLLALGLEDRVMTVTFSEFGRKAAENGNWGTDHGTIAPMLLFGKGVQAGVTGTNVNLSDLANDSQLQYQQHDYRQVFTTILQDWLGAANDTVSATLFEDYIAQKLPLVANNYLVAPDCYLSAIATHIGNNNHNNNPALALDVYPNPARDWAYLRYQSPLYTDALITIWQIDGVQVSSHKVSLQQGDNQIPLNIQSVPAGSYWVHLATANNTLTETVQMIIIN